MSERKVLNKYYPPDFDPTKIPRLHLPKDRQYTVRLMAPCNMKCKTCGEYIYKGKKFNARKETVLGEEYLSLKIFRFYIKCTRCLAEITFKTDPQNADYVVEHGATRNFQALKMAEEQAEREERERIEEEAGNPMKLLESRTKASKQEMDVLEGLEELREMQDRHSSIDHEQVINKHLNVEEILKMQEEEDEAFVRSVFGKDENDLIIKRLSEDDDENENFTLPSTSISESFCEPPASSQPPNKKIKTWDKSVGSLGNGLNKLSGLVKTNSVKKLNPVEKKATEPQPAPAKPNGLGLIASYSDSDSNSE